MKKLAEIVCALILFAYPVSAYAEASTEPWTAPLQTTTFITPGLSYSILLPPIEAYQFGAFAEEDNSIGYSFLGKTFPAADGTKEIYVAAIYRRYPDKRPKTRQYLRERADAHVKEFLETYPTAHIAEDTSSELNYWPTRRIRITNRKEAGIGACRDILFIANYNGLWYIDMLYISRTKEQKARMDTILSSVQFDWTDAKPTVRFDGIQPTQTFTL